VSSPPLLDIRELVVRYDQHHAVLQGVTLAAGPGDRVAILGPSGAGKTSLFRAVNGFAPVSSGSIKLEGVEVTQAGGAELRRLRRRIAVVSQRHDLVDRLAVYQNVMAGALGRWSWPRALRFLVKPTSDELDLAAAALCRVGLEHKLRQPTSDLSGGEHQRVAIARALVQQPVLLLADEPVASLDPRLAEQVLELLCGLARETHVTLLCSLHQPQLAEAYFERVVEMHDGQVMVDRPSLRNSPESPDIFKGAAI
jgi:phosphonate transport system ATP-binding protein